MTTSPDMVTEWKLAERTGLRAFRAGRHLLIVAEGDLPDPGFEVDVQQSPLRIFPQQFNLVRRRLPGFFPAVVVPYRYAEVVVFPVEPPTVVVHHADGRDDVDIEECGEGLAEFVAIVSDDGTGAADAVGSSSRLRFDEAFADAVANLPPVEPPVPDAITHVVVAETGALFGGIAGFRHLFVRVRRLAP